MLTRKYHSLFTLSLAMLWLSVFAPKSIKDRYPTPVSSNAGEGWHVDYFIFAKHTWLRK